VVRERTRDRCWPGVGPFAASIIAVAVIGFIVPGRARQPIAVFRVRLYVTAPAGSLWMVAFTPTARDERGPEFVIVSSVDLAER
jgi:hypothetical protein